MGLRQSRSDPPPWVGDSKPGKLPWPILHVPAKRVRKSGAPQTAMFAHTNGAMHVRTQEAKLCTQNCANELLP